MTDLHEILAAIDPAFLNYEEWVQVGMGIKHEGGTADDWDCWSAQDAGRYHQGECAKKWAGFQGSTSPITAGTLVELAKRQGWSPSKSADYDLPGYDWDTYIAQPREDLRIVDPTWVQPADMAAPDDTDWHPARELRNYLSALFESHEFVGYVVEHWTNDEGRHLPKKGSYTRTAGELLQELARCGDDLSMVLGDYDSAVGAWIRFNPLDGKGVRDENVTAYRYALVESDTIAVDKQAAIYSELELPVAALVHSGGKSLHAIVRINATSKEEYRDRVNFLHKVCQKNGLQIDTQNKNPSRLSRMPGVMRNGVKQYLVGVNQGKESWEAWKEFVEEANDQLPDFEALSNVFNDLPDLAPALIAGVLREGHKMLLSGPSKAGKSYMLLQLTLAIAEGRDWLGWRCAKGRVLYVNLELDRVSCLHRIKDLYGRLGWKPDNLGNIDLWNLRGKAVPMDTLAPKLIRRAHKRGYKAIIIDPIYKVITGDENAADKMAFFCNQFDRVCAELEAAVIYCHHHSKGSQGQKSARDRSSGSGVFARDPDAILDIIELTVSEALRTTMSDRAVCNALAAIMDTANLDWREKIGQDDALVAPKMLECARDLLGPGSEIDADMAAVRAKVEHTTAWRLEGTLREFAPIEPRRFTFQHPIHVPDNDGLLVDAKADGEEPAWKAEQQAAKDARAKKRKEDAFRLGAAFLDPHFEHGYAELAALASTLNMDEKRVKALLPDANLLQCVDGRIRTREEGEAFNAANPDAGRKPKAVDREWEEKLTRTRMAIQQAQREAPDGIATTGAVEQILGVTVNTARKWVAKLPEYQRNDNGQIVPAEAAP